MADPQDAYQRTIDFAAKRYATAVDGYHAIERQIADLSSNPADIGTGGSQETQYKALQKQLEAAAKSWSDAENDYQTAIQAQDKARNDAKEVYPAGQTRTRLDTTAGNVLVSVTEIADGRGGWTVDPASVKRVSVEGGESGATRINAPSSDKKIVSMKPDGSLVEVDNPNYQADKSAGPQAVPTSEFIYQDGKVVHNEAYRPPNAEINTTAEYINDPAHPGQLIKNPNYRAPAPPPMTPGQTAADKATEGVAQDAATAGLEKAQADARAAKAAADQAESIARQRPTDQQAQQAIATAQRGLDLANQNLEQAIKQAGTLNPVLVEQAKATLDQTRANTQKGLQGDLYGRAEQIRQIRSLVLSGDVGPAEADSMVAALNRGTSVYQASVQQQADRSTARGQDLSNKNSLAGNFTSAMTSGFSTLADMNKYAKVGSTAGADAFLALLNIAQDRLKSYELPPAQATDYLGAQPQQSNLSGLVNAAQQATQPAVAQPSYGGMNIGSGAASNPQPPMPQPLAQPGSGTAGVNIIINQPHPVDQTQGQLNSAYQPETSAQSMARNNVSGLVSTAARKVPASEDDIWSAYGVRPPTGAGVM